MASCPPLSFFPKFHPPQAPLQNLQEFSTNHHQEGLKFSQNYSCSPETTKISSPRRNDHFEGQTVSSLSSKNSTPPSNTPTSLGIFQNWIGSPIQQILDGLSVLAVSSRQYWWDIEERWPQSLFHLCRYLQAGLKSGALRVWLAAREAFGKSQRAPVHLALS